jgi:hypothetical protein
MMKHRSATRLAPLRFNVTGDGHAWGGLDNGFRVVVEADGEQKGSSPPFATRQARHVPSPLAGVAS